MKNFKIGVGLLAVITGIALAWLVYFAGVSYPVVLTGVLVGIALDLVGWAIVGLSLADII
jgi:hypothetical protein